MTAPSILLVDDDTALARVLSAALEEEQFVIVTAPDGKAGLHAFRQGSFDLLLLDVLMPEMDGLELCRRIRQTSKVPIIFLTSRADEIDRITGLEMGGDDYVSKPFSTRELVARIRAVLRRSTTGEAQAEPERLSVGQLTIDVGHFEMTWKHEPVALTRSEFLLLTALARQPGLVFSRNRLIDLVRGDDAVITERTIDTFVKRIRQKISRVDANFDEIETVVGLGYRLKRAR